MSAEPPRKRRGMPRGMYIGSAWIGFSLLMLLCWMLSLWQSERLLEQGLGNPRNFRLLLNLMAVFGFALPMLLGIRTLSDAVDDFEREIIVEALHQAEFNQTRAADRLGTTRRILKYRMDKLGIREK